MTDPRLRLALDQNFPIPLITAVSAYIPQDIKLTHITNIDPRLSELSDRKLFIALRQLGYDGLVTNNYKMLSVPEELAAIVKTKAVVVAANILLLNYAHRPPRDAWTYFSKAAERLQRTPHDLWDEVKVTDGEMAHERQQT